MIRKSLLDEAIREICEELGYDHIEVLNNAYCRETHLLRGAIVNIVKRYVNVTWIWFGKYFSYRSYAMVARSSKAYEKALTDKEVPMATHEYIEKKLRDKGIIPSI
jgi:hypothetical protein